MAANVDQVSSKNRFTSNEYSGLVIHKINVNAFVENSNSTVISSGNETTGFCF